MRTARGSLLCHHCSGADPFVSQGLEGAGFVVDQASDGETARAVTESYDAAIVDDMLPTLDGLSLIEALRGPGRPGSLLTPAPHRSGHAGSSASGSSADGFATRRWRSERPSSAEEDIAREGGGTASTALSSKYGDDEASQVPGKPTRTHATRSDPGEVSASTASQRRRCSLPSNARRRPSRPMHFGAPSRGLRTPCERFAPWVTPGPRITRFRLVADLGRMGLDTHRVSNKVSKITSRHLVLLSSNAITSELRCSSHPDSKHRCRWPNVADLIGSTIQFIGYVGGVLFATKAFRPKMAGSNLASNVRQDYRDRCRYRWLIY